jgi:hypothetical protein
MDLTTLARNNPEAFEKKTVDQIVSIAADGKLIDGSECSLQFREFLKYQSAETIVRYTKYCLSHIDEHHACILQDLVNEFGRRLDFNVVPGKYRGSHGADGYDGIWAAGKKQLVIVSKTTDDYKVNIDRLMASFEREGASDKSGVSFYGLIVTGKQDTWDIETQIKGGRFFSDVRVIGVQALFKLLAPYEATDNKKLAKKIRDFLFPKDYVRLDQLVTDIFDPVLNTEEGTEETAEAAKA